MKRTVLASVSAQPIVTKLAGTPCASTLSAISIEYKSRDAKNNGPCNDLIYTFCIYILFIHKYVFQR